MGDAAGRGQHDPARLSLPHASGGQGGRNGIVAGPRPKILVFDSGLGGLTVFDELRIARPDADFVYAADDLGFPYGDRPEAALKEHILAALTWLIAVHRPDAVVVACNTASTLVLPPLRARWPDLPFVGTVPAIKPAAAASRSRVIAVLATPGTVARDYTRGLIEAHAAHCRVVLVGSHALAPMAEAAMAGEDVSQAAIAAEIAPCFVDEDGRRTDAIVLACTHYPLLLPQLTCAAPWPVTWIDPAAAIARQLARVVATTFPLEEISPAAQSSHAFMFTSGVVPSRLLQFVLQERGLTAPMPV